MITAITLYYVLMFFLNAAMLRKTIPEELREYTNSFHAIFACACASALWPITVPLSWITMIEDADNSH